MPLIDKIIIIITNKKKKYRCTKKIKALKVQKMTKKKAKEGN